MTKVSRSGSISTRYVVVDVVVEQKSGHVEPVPIPAKAGVEIQRALRIELGIASDLAAAGGATEESLTQRWESQPGTEIRNDLETGPERGDDTGKRAQGRVVAARPIGIPLTLPGNACTAEDHDRPEIPFDRAIEPQLVLLPVV